MGKIKQTKKGMFIEVSEDGTYNFHMHKLNRAEQDHCVLMVLYVALDSLKSQNEKIERKMSYVR